MSASVPRAAAPASEQDDFRRATLNILEDFNAERDRMLETQRAILNMFEDSVAEKNLLDNIHRAVVNILEDMTLEKTRLEETQRAVGNILEDISEEKMQFEKAQRAMLNLLDDFDLERAKVESANTELVSSLDTTRRAKEEAETANRELDSFSYSVAHDLRAPLRAMDGFSHALLKYHHDTLAAEGQDFLRRVCEAAQRMATLIDNLLLLSRITRAEKRITDVSLSDLARRAMKNLMAAESRGEADVVIADGLSVRGDAGLLEILIGNLLGNAWKFTRPRERAHIEVGTSELQGETVYFVRDNGVGFDMEYASKLFAPFQRLHGPAEFEGTGIGLSIVARIIRRHGGRIWAEAEVDRGAVFHFTIGMVDT